MWRCSNIPLSPTHDFFLQFLKYHCSQSYRPFYLFLFLPVLMCTGMCTRHLLIILKNILKILTLRKAFLEEKLHYSISIFNSLEEWSNQCYVPPFIHSFIHSFIVSLAWLEYRLGNAKFAIGLVCFAWFLVYFIVLWVKKTLTV